MLSLVSIFTTGGGSCVPWGLIITLLDSRTSLHIFTKSIKLLKLCQGSWDSWYPHYLNYPTHRRVGIYQYVGGITELHLFCYLSLPMNPVMFHTVCLCSLSQVLIGRDPSFLCLCHSHTWTQSPLSPSTMLYGRCPTTFQGTTIPYLWNNPDKQIDPGWLGWLQQNNSWVDSCCCHDNMICILENLNTTPPSLCQILREKPPNSNPSDQSI